MARAPVDDYPSMNWILIPAGIVIVSVLAKNWYQARQLRVHGIGKGAPGFQTGVRRLRVTPEIAARIRAGEDVSPDEIARASAEMDERERRGQEPEPVIPTSPPDSLRGRMAVVEAPSEEDSPANEWLPDSQKKTPKKKAGRKK